MEEVILYRVPFLYHLPGSEAIPLLPQIRASWFVTALSAERRDLVATFTKCDLAERRRQHLSGARVDLAPTASLTSQLSPKPAVADLS